MIVKFYLTVAEHEVGSGKFTSLLASTDPPFYQYKNDRQVDYTFELDIPALDVPPMEQLPVLNPTETNVVMTPKTKRAKKRPSNKEALSEA